MPKINLDLEQFKYTGDLEIEPVAESFNDILNSHPINVNDVQDPFEEAPIDPINVNDVQNPLQELPIEPIEHIEIPNIEIIESEDDNTSIPAKKERKTPLSLKGAPKIGPHVCECCGQKFDFLCNLKLHQQQKSGEREFVCPVYGCNKAYAVKKRLAEHLKLKNHYID